MKAISHFIRKIVDLVNEIESNLVYEEHLLEQIKNLDKQYQAKKASYPEYIKKRDNLLKGKTKKDCIDQYKAYNYYLLKRIEYFNSQIFLETYKDRSYEDLKYVPKIKKIQKPEPHKQEPPEPRPKPQLKSPRFEERVQIPKLDVSQKKILKAEEIITKKEAAAGKTPGRPALEILKAQVLKKPEIEMPGIERPRTGAVQSYDAIEAEQLEKPYLKKPTKPALTRRIQLGETISPERLGLKEKKPFFSRIFDVFKRKKTGELVSTEEETPPSQIFRPRTETLKRPKKVESLEERLSKLGLKKRKSLFQKIIEEEKEEKEKPEKIKGIAKVGNIFGLNLIRDFVNKLTLSHLKKSNLVHQDLRLRFLKTGGFEDLGKTEHIGTNLLVKEAERVKRIMEQKRSLKLYKPSIVGSLANITVRRISFFLIDQFPNFFRELYNNLRYANVRVLSNTYVNIMVFVTLASILLSFFLFPLVFIIQGAGLFMILSKTLIMCILVGASVFAGFYLYPSLKIKERRKNIRTNLPFAINHMAAVAGSGVPPDIIFRLISQTEEYGEICEETKKIDQFISVFGYDLITAIKSVSTTTPSKFFREFLEGMASSIESGGDLQRYMKAKSKESMLDYELERQKYTEAVSTYSDVYTGILIAAPLFFVSALALISVLGGEIAGIAVDVIIALGTYLVIPILNVLFIVFIEINQPEI